MINETIKVIERKVQIQREALARHHSELLGHEALAMASTAQQIQNVVEMTLQKHRKRLQKA